MNSMYLVEPYGLATDHGPLAAALRRLGHYFYGLAQAFGEIHDLLPSQQEACFTRLPLQYQTQKYRICLSYSCPESRDEKLSDTWWNFSHSLAFQ